MNIVMSKILENLGRQFYYLAKKELASLHYYRIGVIGELEPNHEIETSLCFGTQLVVLGILQRLVI